MAPVKTDKHLILDTFLRNLIMDMSVEMRPHSFVPPSIAHIQ